MRILRRLRGPLTAPGALRPPEGPGTDHEAAEQAVEASREALREAHGRWREVHTQGAVLSQQLERNHLGERLEAAMALKRPRHA